MKKTGMIALLLMALVLFAGCARTVRQGNQPAASAQSADQVQTQAGQDTLSSDINDAAALTDDVDTSDMDQLDKDLDIQI